MAELENPQRLAEQKLNNLTLSNYKMKMVEMEMDNMDIPKRDQEGLRNEIQKLKENMVEAAIELATVTIMCQMNINAMLEENAQTLITFTPESPIDFGLSTVRSFPFSSDTMNFDVQYFSREENDEGSKAHTSQVSSFVNGKFSSMGIGAAELDVRSNVKETMQAQTTNHTLEGTIVIIAHCTHRASDIISPVYLNYKKALTAWNATFPDDPLNTDAASMFNTALAPIKNGEEEKALHLLSGCTRGSSFVGLVHLLKTEYTSSSQSSAALAGKMQAMLSRDMVLQKMTGGFGASSSLTSNLKNLLSTSKIENHCSLVTRGIMPNIAARDMMSIVKTLQPDPREVMAQLEAIQSIGVANMNATLDFESAGEGARTGEQFMQLTNAFASNTISKMEELNRESNKVLDTNSMMNALTDYIKRAAEGNCGIPINFYIKRITKRDVAACYIEKCYPNGAATSELARKGALGQEGKNSE
eukprot:CAMPEP_0194138122 /NCGR_PEP_ID=MMETSP0152-20130528/7963_1 /TAXON_ID=1049557 /ORGANISM="Thalassiothrix antarctica, Strain L6-D1" /LENGTH=472 /DNA_ID=CAMNT_0038835465 /DNA_START=126 /DNA_END=1541 /DNA_ORIENTATION=+